MLHRTRELAELDRIWRSDKPELVFVVGRRRAGKSFLLTRFIEDHRGFYYQAFKTGHGTRHANHTGNGCSARQSQARDLSARGPYLLFWHRFVAPLRATGAVDILTPRQLWSRHVAPRLPEHMGGVFEAICRSFVARGAHGRLPFLPDRVGEWWTHDAQHQIDVVALGPEGQVLLGECKWGLVTHHDLSLLEQRRDLIARELPGIARIHLAMFTAEAVRDRRLLESIRSGELLLFTPEDLLE